MGQWRNDYRKEAESLYKLNLELKRMIDRMITNDEMKDERIQNLQLLIRDNRFAFGICPVCRQSVYEGCVSSCELDLAVASLSAYQ